MRLEEALPGGGGNAAFEGANQCVFKAEYTDNLLKHAGEIARALNAKRVEQGLDRLAQRFVTADNPEGFWLRVTSHMAQWVVPMWAAHKAFEDAQVSYVRTMDPDEIATRPV
jgi:hypothetical protein